MLPSSQSGVGRCTWKSIARGTALPYRFRRAGPDAPRDFGQAVGAHRDRPPAFDPPGRPRGGPDGRVGRTELDKLPGTVGLDDDIVGRVAQSESVPALPHQ